MTYNSGTSTDYIDLLGKVIQAMTQRGVSVLALNAGGTGHAVGDVLDINATGATSSHLAKVEVVTEAAGVITAVRIFRGGAYTVDPTTTTGNAQSATTGSGIGATFDLTFAAIGWTQTHRQSEVDTVGSVAAGGTGYSVSDTLTLIGGVIAPGGTAATFNVDTLSGSAVATISIVDRGDYEVFPTDPILVSVSPGGGSGCTLNINWRDTSGDTLVVLTGDAGSSTAPVVGIKTYSGLTDESSTNSIFNWALFGLPGYSSLTNMHLQPNRSRGFSTANNGDITTSTSGDGAFLPLKDSDAFDMEYWISVTGRRVKLIVKVETASTTYYAQCSFGLLNQYGVTTELPFPMYVVASSDRKRVWYGDISAVFGGLSEVISRSNGPMFVWSPEGAWLKALVSTISSNTSTTPSVGILGVPRIGVLPLALIALHPVNDDRIWAFATATGFDQADLTPASSPTVIVPTPDTGGDLFPLYPVTIVQADSTSGFHRVFGEVDGVWFIHQGGSGLSSEDRIIQGGNAYTIFQNGNRIQPFSYMAMNED